MFQGSYVAIVTPLDDSGKVNFEVYKSLLKRQVDGGTSGIVVCGTTGESPTIDPSDQLKLFELTVNELKGTGVKTIAGTGSNNTQKTVEMTTKAKALGVDGASVSYTHLTLPTKRIV